ncbi:MAG: hypothetical protein B7Z41_02110 [Rhizobiales bacterium 12-66-7]|jgi:hypothetical protein|nr:MAG: hypothetical protein B7Z41_02110 [Rhizobiales bacterium 12-66-7]OYX67660.1 MAG: hypothetical protein B7Y95_22610 [Rhizobiales bacterium 32-66-11]
MVADHDPQLYFHVRIVMGMILGLSVTRLLGGFAKFVQHPAVNEIAPLHLGWAVMVLLNALMFWWWEFRLINVPRWTFELYLFLLTYCSVFYFMCVLLFPDNLGDYPSYRAYFAAKRKWFFGFFALSQALDQIDSWIKGADYFLTLGWPYSVTTGLLILMSIVAMFSSNGRFQAAFLALGLINEVGWIFWLLHTVN